MTDNHDWGQPVLADDFNGTTLDSNRWGVYDDLYGDEPRSPSAIRVSQGELQIVGGFGQDDFAPELDVSGGIASLLDQQYGRWEVRFRVDAGAGYSAVILLWPETERWPDDGEITLARLNQSDRQTANSEVHNGPGHHNEGRIIRADFTQWHTIAVDWLPELVTFSLDEVPQWALGGTPATRTLIPSTSPMHLAIQLDQGCDEHTPCRTGDTPPYVAMHIDWVKIYH